MADQKGNQYISGFSGLAHADVSGYIGKTLTSAEQTLVGSLITMAEMYFCQQTHRNFLATSTTYYDIFNGGLVSYTPSNFPIKEVTKITLDGNIVYEKGGSSNKIVLGRDFFVFNDSIQFDLLQESTVDNRNALIIYYSIDTSFNADAKFALLLWVSNFFLNREMGGKDLSTLNAGGMTQQFTQNVPDYIKTVINSYKKYDI